MGGCSSQSLIRINTGNARMMVESVSASHHRGMELETFTSYWWRNARKLPGGDNRTRKMSERSSPFLR
jgi:hypothetical protein